ncbi:MAG: phosphoenolpyruvate carboxykinase (ATP), partial [Pseudomonadota bacterium]
MNTHGTFNQAHGLDKLGIKTSGQVYYNLTEAELYEYAVSRGEAQITAEGPLVAYTGEFTGRTPKDKFVVKDGVVDDVIWWDGNKAMTPDAFQTLHADFLAHAEDKDLFVQDLMGGADPENRIHTRVVCEKAWHNLFIRNLLIRPERSELAEFVNDMTIIDLPSFVADPARHGCRTQTVIAVDLTRKIVLIGGTHYAGEMKKSVFTMLNYVLPGKGVMAMHCSANVSKDGEAAVFFGLSGTGKTTLSADPERTLIGDDEHGWGENGIFNFEGGCYAKAINLSAEAEPEIFATSKRFGTVFENVVLDEQRRPDFTDNSLTENTRIAYPL